MNIFDDTKLYKAVCLDGIERPVHIISENKGICVLELKDGISDIVYDVVPDMCTEENQECSDIPRLEIYIQYQKSKKVISLPTSQQKLKYCLSAPMRFVVPYNKRDEDIMYRQLRLNRNFDTSTIYRINRLYRIIMSFSFMRYDMLLGLMHSSGYTITKALKTLHNYEYSIDYNVKKLTDLLDSWSEDCPVAFIVPDNKDKQLKLIKEFKAKEYGKVTPYGYIYRHKEREKLWEALKKCSSEEKGD